MSGRPSLSFFLWLRKSTSVASGDDAEKNEMVMDKEKEDVRKVALEFMTRLGMLRKVNGWTAAIVRSVWRWGSLQMITSKCRCACVF